jgi:hypothetical protein
MDKFVILRLSVPSESRFAPNSYKLSWLLRYLFYILIHSSILYLYNLLYSLILIQMKSRYFIL